MSRSRGGDVSDSLLTLLSREDARIEHAALLVAADAQPGLDVGTWLSKLDEVAEPLAKPGALGATPIQSARAIALPILESGSCEQ